MIPAGEAGHMPDVTDDRGGDDRAHPEQPGQAGPGGADRDGQLLPGVADPGVDAAQVLGELGGELAAGCRHRVGRLGAFNRLERARRARCVAHKNRVAGLTGVWLRGARSLPACELLRCTGVSGRP